MANKITIQFEAKGAEKLRAEINKLSKAHNGLSGAHKKVTKSGKKVSGGMMDITNKGRLLQNSFATTRSKLLLLSFGFSLVAGSIGKALKMFGEQEKAALKLNNALGFNTIRLRELAAELQTVTGVGDETIINAQGIIASFVRSEEVVASLTTATMDLSTALGMDLNSTANLIGKTIGSTTNSLSRYGISVTGAANSTERIESLLTNVNILFGGTAEVAGSATLGSLNKLSAAFGDLVEGIGNVLANVGVIDMIRFLTGAFTGLNSAIEFAISVMPFYNDALANSAKLSEEDAKAINKRIQGIKSINDIFEIEEKITFLNERRNSIQIALGESQASNNIVQEKAVAINKDVADETMNLNLALDENFNKLEKTNQIQEISIGSQEEFTEALGNSIPIFEQYNDFLGSGALQLENLNDIGIDATKINIDQAESLQELYAITQLLSIAEAQRQGILSSGLQEKFEYNTALNDLAVAEATMLDRERDLLNLAEEETLIRNKKKAGLITETKMNALLNQVTVKKINLSKEDVKMGAAIGKNYKDVGAAASAGAREVVNAKIREMIVNQLSNVFASIPNPFVASVVAAGVSAGISSILEQSLSSMAKIKFEQGGYVGGQRHAQGGTIIEAARGEFVMSRNAVESVGVDNLEAMNQGGGGSSIVINNPIISSEFVETELPELIAEAVRKGADFGMS